MIAPLFAAALAVTPTPGAPPAPAPAAVEIWRGARVGMSPAQVQALFPAAEVLSDGESLLDNAKARVRLAHVRIPSGDPGSAAFYFRSDALNEVRFVADVPSGRTEVNLRRAQAIADELSKTYGKPTTCGPRQGLLAFECDWLTDRLSVSVTYMDVAGQSPLLETAIRAVSDPYPASSRPTAPKGSPADRKLRPPAHN